MTTKVLLKFSMNDSENVISVGKKSYFFENLNARCRNIWQQGLRKAAAGGEVIESVNYLQMRVLPKLLGKFDLSMQMIWLFVGRI